MLGKAGGFVLVSLSTGLQSDDNIIMILQFIFLGIHKFWTPLHNSFQLNESEWNQKHTYGCKYRAAFKWPSRNQIQSNYRANQSMSYVTTIFIQPPTDGIQRVICSVRSKSKTNHVAYFENETMHTDTNQNQHHTNGFTCQPDLLVKPNHH